MNVQAVLFDMDGVVFDTESLYLGLLTCILRELGYEMSREFFISTLGIPSGECRKLYEATYGAGFPYEEVYRRLFAGTDEMIRTQGAPLKPGAEDCFRGLKARGLNLVLATSAPRFAAENYFRAVPALNAMLTGKVCGDDVKNGKPDPEIFLKAAKLAGCEPQACVGVEDSKSGLQAIRASGAQPVMIPDLLPYSDALKPFADAVLGSLRELLPLIDRLNAARP